MAEILRFLIVDQNNDGLNLLVRTVSRKFPAAKIIECQDSETAVEIVKTQKLSAILTHRAVGMGGIELIQRMRHASSHVPIIMVSSIDRDVAARQAGATKFVLYDEWLTIGPVVEELLNRPAPHGSAAAGPSQV